jgi:hypothetical protein
LQSLSPSLRGIGRRPGASGLLPVRQAADGSHREPVARSMEAPPRLQQRMRHSGQRGAKRQHDQGRFEIAHSDPHWSAGQYRPPLGPRMKGERSSTPKRWAGAGTHVSEPLQNRAHLVPSPEAALDPPAARGARNRDFRMHVSSGVPPPACLLRPARRPRPSPTSRGESGPARRT